MPAHKSAATSMVPCKADMVVGRCVYCLQQHPLPVVALPAARRLALQYVQPTLGSLPSLLITSFEMMLVGRRSTASQIGLWGHQPFLMTVWPLDSWCASDTHTQAGNSVNRSHKLVTGSQSYLQHAGWRCDPGGLQRGGSEVPAGPWGQGQARRDLLPAPDGLQGA